MQVHEELLTLGLLLFRDCDGAVNVLGLGAASAQHRSRRTVGESVRAFPCSETKHTRQHAQTVRTRRPLSVVFHCCRRSSRRCHLLEAGQQ
jgi:hypothetical protein